MTSSLPQGSGPLNSQSLAMRVQAERRHRGWTMSELVRRTGINRGTLYRLERGDTDRPQMKTIQALAGAFDVSVRSLVVRTDATHPAAHPQPADHHSFDRATNPLVSEVIEEQPGLFADWSEENIDELYSLFGVGGQLTRSGVICAAEAINRKRETICKLQVVLETGLREQAHDLIDVLYRMVQVPVATAPDRTVPQPGTEQS